MNKKFSTLAIACMASALFSSTQAATISQYPPDEVKEVEKAILQQGRQRRKKAPVRFDRCDFVVRLSGGKPAGQLRQQRLRAAAERKFRIAPRQQHSQYPAVGQCIKRR